MDRGKIKIIEFGKDDESPRAPASHARNARDTKARDMKIVEFDHDPRGGGSRAPPRPEPGRIRIVEFDDDQPRTGAERTSPPERGPSASRARVGAIKIKEFDDEGKERPRRAGGASSRIRIVEFD